MRCLNGVLIDMASLAAIVSDATILLYNCSSTGVTNVVPAGARSPARTKYVARGPVLKITLA